MPSSFPIFVRWLPPLRVVSAQLCANAAEGAVCDTYCSTTVHAGLKPLRHEPCFPHQTLKGELGHETPDRYIGDFNAARPGPRAGAKSSAVKAVG